MGTLIACDPGVHGVHCAYFSEGTLIMTPYSILRAALPMTNGGYVGAADVLVIEIPQVYRGAAAKGDPNDLIDLAFTAGMLTASVQHNFLQMVRPREWKGQTPKHIHHYRLWQVLTAAERALLPEDSEERIQRAVACKGRGYESWKTHNLLDAVGIGLFSLGRLTK